MSDVPEHLRVRMRQLTDGPYAGTMWRWTFHDGSTWALLAFDGFKAEPRDLVAWACVTNQEEPLSVLGVFVDELYRGDGLAARLVDDLVGITKEQLKDGPVYAVSERFPKYVEILEKHGLSHLEWV